MVPLVNEKSGCLRGRFWDTGNIEICLKIKARVIELSVEWREVCSWSKAIFPKHFQRNPKLSKNSKIPPLSGDEETGKLQFALPHQQIGCQSLFIYSKRAVKGRMCEGHRQAKEMQMNL